MLPRNDSLSPNKMHHSAAKHGSQRKLKTTGLSPTRKLRRPYNSKVQDIVEMEVELKSPTSMHMKNSFIIKNVGKNMDNLYKQISKKKSSQQQYGFSSESTHQNSFADVKVKSMTGIGEGLSHDNFVRFKRPSARDGHSIVVVDHKFMVVFGGDRHHMPFNDLHVLDLEAEYQAQSYVFVNGE